MVRMRDVASQWSVRAGRRRLLILWLSNFTQMLAAAYLLPLSIRRAVWLVPDHADEAWRAILAYVVLPFVLLAPLHGALCSHFSKRWLLTFSAFLSLLLAGAGSALAATYGAPAIGFWTLACLALSTAMFLTARDALLPEAAYEAQLPLSRVVAWMGLGTATALVLGMFLLPNAHDAYLWPRLSESWPDPVNRLTKNELPTTMLEVCALQLLSGVSALFVRFPAKSTPSHRPLRRPGGFLAVTKRIFADRPLRGALLTQALVDGFLLAGVAASFGDLLGWKFPDQFMFGEHPFYWIAWGAITGCFIAGLQGHPRRMLGLIPLAVTAIAISFQWAVNVWYEPWLPLFVGALCGLLKVPVAAGYLLLLPADARSAGVALGRAASCLTGVLLAVLFFSLSFFAHWSAVPLVWICLGLLSAGTILAWITYFRESLELVIEILIWPIYRIRARGPGKYEIPVRGPVLVIANHSSWFDPIWLAKVIPRRIIPMMTSRFYDMPVLRWFMLHVVHAIRVQAAQFRREAPELDEAVAALDRGECVTIFPEGFMRRGAERPLRQFGQGVWRILSKRHATPVVVCWIEGGWGSYTSYADGPPTVNKRFDFWRRIRIAIEAPEVLDPALLEDARATRMHLMRVCLEARRYLGLEPLGNVAAVVEEQEDREEAK
jgi:1-acyl-sn-glycerol-3-phosphate acyltransferase